MRRVARRGHDVAMLQIVSPQEAGFPYRGDLEFQDLESGQRQLVNAGAIEQQYHAAFSEFLERCRAHAHRDGLDYALIGTDSPPEHALRSYLLRRSEPA